MFAIGDGLYLQVRPTAKTKVFIFRGVVEGKQLKKKIADWPETSLKQAKRLVTLKRIEFEEQAKLKVELEKQGKSVHVQTFGELVDLERKNPAHNKLGKGTRDNHESIRNFLEKKWGDKPVEQITLKEVKGLIANYARHKDGKYKSDLTAARKNLASRIRTIYRYADLRGVYTNEALKSFKVTDLSGYEVNKRDRTLTDAEIIWLHQQTDWWANGIRFLLYTGLRISESLKGYRANRKFIDGQYNFYPDENGDFWYVPETKTTSKNKQKKKSHWVFLSDSAKAQLPLAKYGDKAYRQKLYDALERDGLPRFKPHDCRRTFSTRAAKSICRDKQGNIVDPLIALLDRENHIIDRGADMAAIEIALNHSFKDLRDVYQHHSFSMERIECCLILEKRILEVLSQYKGVAFIEQARSSSQKMLKSLQDVSK